MNIIKKTYSWIQNLIYYLVVAVVGILGVIMLQLTVTEFGNESIGFSLFMLFASLIPLGFPLLVIRDKLRDRKLFRWLAEHVEELNEGVEGPSGMVYSFDTELVSYEANLSLIAISTNVRSAFYLRGSNHLIPKTLYTLFTIVFGWWMLDPKVWLANLVAIGENLSDANVITVRELFPVEETESLEAVEQGFQNEDEIT